MDHEATIEPVGSIPMAITKFDRSSCKLLSADIEAALQEVAARHGLTVSDAGGSFRETEYVAKMRFSVADPAALLAGEQIEFTRNSYAFGLKPKHYGA